MNLPSTVCLMVGLYAALVAGRIYLKNRSVPPPRASTISGFGAPSATLLLAAAIALPSTLQFFFPVILSVLRRDYARFLAGDWWRVITAMFVQDAGVAGAAFNIITLLLVGAVAEQLWGSARMIGIFFAGGIAAEVVAFAWQPIGAGNSVGNFSLAASIAIACLGQADSKAKAFAWLALGADAVLVLLRDIHGAAALAGAVLALVLSRWGPSSPRQVFQQR
jgi:membrane associated rhomboid family serine protease